MPATLRHTLFISAILLGIAGSGYAGFQLWQWQWQQLPSADRYVVDHPSATSVVAPDGRLVEQLSHNTPPPEIVAAIRRWLSR